MRCSGVHHHGLLACANAAQMLFEAPPKMALYAHFLALLRAEPEDATENDTLDISPPQF
jgi:hypothetical protein